MNQQIYTLDFNDDENEITISYAFSVLVSPYDAYRFLTQLCGRTSEEIAYRSTKEQFNSKETSEFWRVEIEGGDIQFGKPTLNDDALNDLDED